MLHFTVVAAGIICRENEINYSTVVRETLRINSRGAHKALEIDDCKQLCHSSRGIYRLYRIRHGLTPILSVCG